MRANSALVREILPALSTVAIAIGVDWKKRMKRTSAVRCGSVGLAAGAVEHQRPRGAGRAVGAERDLVEQPHRHRAPAAGLEVDVHHLGLHLAGRRGERGEQRGAVAGDDVGELQPAGADLGEIVVEPGGERGVEVADVAVAIDREEAGRRVIEIVDGVLQLLEDVLLALAVARHVGDGPQRQLAAALARRRAAARAAAASSPPCP